MWPTAWRRAVCILLVHTCTLQGVALCKDISLDTTGTHRNGTTVVKDGTKNTGIVSANRDRLGYASDSKRKPDTYDDCQMEVDANSKDDFAYKIRVHSYNFVHMNLTFSPDNHYTAERWVVEPALWVWTFSWSEGARQYLYWPIEAGIWSLGLLDSYTYGPMQINIIAKNNTGNCSIVIGQNKTNFRIAKALANMTYEISRTKMEYNTSYWCYKERIIIQPYILYQFCKHVICPLEAMGYKCCRFEWVQKERRRIVACMPNPLIYDQVWWIAPFALGSLLFMYFPLLLMYVVQKLDWQDRSGPEQAARSSLAAEDSESDDETCSIPLLAELPESDCQDFPQDKWLYLDGTKPVTISTIIGYPIVFCTSVCPLSMSRFIRVICVILSLAMIFIKLLIYASFKYEFVLHAVKTGVPMDFNSMLAGYEDSKINFLVWVGGPFIACGIYMTCAFLFVVTPSKLSVFLEKGIPNNTDISRSPLTFDLQFKERMGSIPIQSRPTYLKLYSLMLAHLFMLLNPDFWRNVVAVQVQRWRYFFSSGCIRVVATLPYCILCLFEIMWCMMYYGIPCISFIYICLRAYVLNLMSFIKYRGRYIRLFGYACVCLICMAFFYFIYMFCIIFLDGFIFIARILVFTYSGLFAYPRLSYGYVIFGLMIVFYLWECFRNISKVYYELLKMAIRSNVKLQKNRPDNHNYVRYRDDCPGIPEDAFEFVIKRLKPIRNEVFISVVKMICIVLLLLISVKLLMNFKRIKDMSVMVHSFTTIFICLVPKLLQTLFSSVDTHTTTKKRLLREVQKTLSEYWDSRENRHLLINTV